MTDDNPLDAIEDQKFWYDIGKQGFLIMQGAVEAGATTIEAIHVAAGFYAGMFRGVINPNEEEEEKDD